MIDSTGSAIYAALNGLAARQRVISNNMANLDTVRPTSEPAFQARFVVAQAIGTGQEAMTGGPAGAEVTGITFGDPAGRLVSDPTNPLADSNGMVRYPDVDMGDQMT